MQLPDVAPHDVTRNLILMNQRTWQRLSFQTSWGEGRAQDLFQGFGGIKNRELAVCHAAETHQIQEA